MSMTLVNFFNAAQNRFWLQVINNEIHIGGCSSKLMHQIYIYG